MVSGFRAGSQMPNTSTSFQVTCFSDCSYKPTPPACTRVTCGALAPPAVVLAYDPLPYLPASFDFQRKSLGGGLFSIQPYLFESLYAGRHVPGSNTSLSSDSGSKTYLYRQTSSTAGTRNTRSLSLSSTSWEMKKEHVEGAWYAHEESARVRCAPGTRINNLTACGGMFAASFSISCWDGVYEQPFECVPTICDAFNGDPSNLHDTMASATNVSTRVGYQTVVNVTCKVGHRAVARGHVGNVLCESPASYLVTCGICDWIRYMSRCLSP
jgi:hypothetical protein